MFFDRGIISLNDLQFDVDNVRSYDSIKQKGPVTNFIKMNSRHPGNLLTVGNFDKLNFYYNAIFF